MWTAYAHFHWPVFFDREFVQLYFPPPLAICPTHKIKRSGCVSMRYMFDGGGNGENRLEGGIYDGWWPSAPITPASLNIVRPPTSLSLSPNNICRRRKHVRLEENRFFFFHLNILGLFSRRNASPHRQTERTHIYTHTKRKFLSVSRVRTARIEN